MTDKNSRTEEKREGFIFAVFSVLVIAGCLGFCGCQQMGSYSNRPLFREEVKSVYLEMFDNRSFWRGIEYKLTDALGKRIEVETPYKIVSNIDYADTIISGQIVAVGQAVPTVERETGRALEKEVQLQAVVNWKNLKTGALLIDNQTVSSSMSYSEWQQQGFDYGSALAANKLAQRIVELMETEW